MQFPSFDILIIFNIAIITYLFVVLIAAIWGIIQSIFIWHKPSAYRREDFALAAFLAVMHPSGIAIYSLFWPKFFWQMILVPFGVDYNSYEELNELALEWRLFWLCVILVLFFLGRFYSKLYQNWPYSIVTQDKSQQRQKRSFIKDGEEELERRFRIITRSLPFKAHDRDDTTNVETSQMTEHSDRDNDNDSSSD